MRHFVHGPDGQKYGPADLVLLLQWKAEGRITPDTQLEPEVGGTPVPARDFPELYPELQEKQAYGEGEWSNESEPTEVDRKTRNLANWTWALGPMAIFCCPAPAGIAAIICAVNASRRGHPQGTTLVIYAVASLVFGLALNIYLWQQMGGIEGLLKNR